MQVRAIFERSTSCARRREARSRDHDPIIMNENELKLIVFGKKIEGKHIRGLVDIEREVRDAYKVRPAAYKIGTMVELPAAALGSDELAR